MTAGALNLYALRFWREMKFPIGEGNSIGLDSIALPCPIFAPGIPTAGAYWLDFWIGHELAQAAFKLQRFESIERGEVCNTGGDDLRIFSTILDEWIGLDPSKLDMRCGFIAALELMSDHALNAPERLPLLHQRIDSLSDHLLRARIAAIIDEYRASDTGDVSVPTIFDDSFDAFNAFVLATARRRGIGGRS